MGVVVSGLWLMCRNECEVELWVCVNWNVGCEVKLWVNWTFVLSV